MPKKIAVVVRENQEEGLRMAVGAIMADDEVEVFVLDKKVESNEKNDLNMETITDFEMPLYSNTKENESAQFMSTEEIAAKFPEYDLVVPF